MLTYFALLVQVSRQILSCFCSHSWKLSFFYIIDEPGHPCSTRASCHRRENRCAANNNGGMAKYCRRAGFFTETQRWLENTQEHQWIPPPPPGSACTPAAFPNNGIFGGLIGALHTPIKSTVQLSAASQEKLNWSVSTFFFVVDTKRLTSYVDDPFLYVTGASVDDGGFWLTSYRRVKTQYIRLSSIFHQIL